MIEVNKSTLEDMVSVLAKLAINGLEAEEFMDNLKNVEEAESQETFKIPLKIVSPVYQVKYLAR